MKSYLKFLSRNKVYTFINVVGLSVSFAFVIIIGLYSQMEFGSGVMCAGMGMVSNP